MHDCVRLSSMLHDRTFFSLPPLRINFAEQPLCLHSIVIPATFVCSFLSWGNEGEANQIKMQNMLLDATLKVDQSRHADAVIDFLMSCNSHAPMLLVHLGGLSCLPCLFLGRPFRWLCPRLWLCSPLLGALLCPMVRSLLRPRLHP